MAARRLHGGSRPLATLSGNTGKSCLFRYMSTNPNEDNFLPFHNEPHGGDVQPPLQWSNYHGKIAVLESNSTDGAVKSSQDPAPLLTKPGDAFGESPRVSLLMELQDRVGVLHDVLKYFWKHDINVSRIESRPVQDKQRWGGSGRPKFDFFMDFDGQLSDPNVQRLMQDLGPMTEKLLILDEKDVHWFPRHISELDLIAHRTLDAGVDLESDHPGFNDEVYRKRRAQLAENAFQHQWNMPIPKIEYTPEETATWGAVWDRMEGLWKDYACKEFLVGLTGLEKSRDRIVVFAECLLVFLVVVLYFLRLTRLAIIFLAFYGVAQRKLRLFTR